MAESKENSSIKTEECVICYEEMKYNEKTREFEGNYKKTHPHDYELHTGCCQQPIHHRCFYKCREASEDRCPMCRMTLQELLNKQFSKEAISKRMEDMRKRMEQKS